MINRPSLLTFLRLPQGFQMVPELGAAIQTTDGSMLIQVWYKLPSVRELSAAVISLAKYLRKVGPAAAGYLIPVEPAMGGERLHEVWTETIAVLDPSLAKRIKLLVIERGAQINQALDKRLFPLIETIQEALQRIPDEHRPKTYTGERTWRGYSGFSGYSGTAFPPATETYIEVFKVLVANWLLKTRAMSNIDLQRTTGYSYPTVARALDRLALKNEIVRESDRRVALTDFPHASWQELIALAPSFRQTRAFALPPGEQVVMNDLIERLDQHAPSNTAFGGVLAARHWDPRFNLSGVPRIDIILHLEEQPHYSGNPGMPDRDIGFLRKVDPALRETETPMQRAQVAIHIIRRSKSLFTEGAHPQRRIADPVETLLDLSELGLSEQSEELIRHLSGVPT